MTSVALTPAVKEASMKLASFNGFRSLSELVETLLIDWLDEKSPNWFKETDAYQSVHKVDEEKET